MWTHGVAIRPVPPYAVVEPRTVEAVREGFADDDEDAQRKLDEAFARFETTQPALCSRLEDALERRGLDETARTLGYFLGVCVWLAFDRQFGGRLGRVDETAARAAAAALDLESEIRAAHPESALETEDVVASEQPALMDLIHDHMDVALETRGRGGDVDVDDVQAIYRVVLVELLSLSQAVAPSPGAPARRSEVLA
jgi:hypothetical protein